MIQCSQPLNDERSTGLPPHQIFELEMENFKAPTLWAKE
jgi:hypothetical protein